MSDDYDYFINKIYRSEGFGEKRKRSPQKKRKHPAHEDEAKDHFNDLTNAAEQINKVLEAKKSPNRFCVYREKDEVFFDLVILDDNQKISQTIRKNITHQEFSELIKNIEQLDGFIVDYEA